MSKGRADFKQIEGKTNEPLTYIKKKVNLKLKKLGRIISKRPCKKG